MCNLYYKSGRWEYRLGSFPNREKAEAYWNLVREKLINEVGTDVQPIYVETKKGRGSK